MILTASAATPLGRASKLPHNLFRGRTLVIATMHQKEKVIGNYLQEKLGVVPSLPLGINTDAFGTFTREVKRKEMALATARLKCLKALEITGASLAVASEGSFGMHPNLPWVPANEEWVLLMDTKNKLEIFGYALSLETNLHSEEFSTWPGLKNFAEKAGFPEHGIILSAGNTYLKNIKPEWPNLQQAFEGLIRSNKAVLAETDMRAMRNPSRQKVILQATKAMVKKAFSTCPACKTPGYGTVATKRGLPCRQCHGPTNSVMYHVKGCSQCGRQTQKRVGQKLEDPTYCNFCNP